MLQLYGTALRLMEGFQWKFLELCQNRFYINNQVTYEDFLQFQKIHNLHKKRIYFDAQFFLLIQI